MCAHVHATVYMCSCVYWCVCPYMNVSAIVNACACWCCVHVYDSVYTFVCVHTRVRKSACLPVKVSFPVCFIKCPLFISSLFIAEVVHVCANSRHYYSSLPRHSSFRIHLWFLNYIINTISLSNHHYPLQ